MSADGNAVLVRSDDGRTTRVVRHRHVEIRGKIDGTFVRPERYDVAVDVSTDELLDAIGDQLVAANLPINTRITVQSDELDRVVVELVAVTTQWALDRGAEAALIKAERAAAAAHRARA